MRATAGAWKVNGKPAKPAASVAVGDRVVVRSSGLERILEVAHVYRRAALARRVAAECLVDHTPPPTLADESGPGVAPETAPQDGRRTRRRQLDRFRQR